MALGSIAVVVVLVVVLVIVKVTGSNGPVSLKAPTDRPASAAVAAAVTGVPISVMDAVGVSTAVSPPLVDRSQPLLMLNAKPGAIYIGGEFCPLCAAERWAIVVAFSKFGSFTGLDETTSSPWDGTAYPTLSFRHATYSSALITFQPVEFQGNDTHGLGTRKVIRQLTAQQSALWATYANSYTGGNQGFPFLDIGNRVLGMTSSYDPTVLTGLTQAQIARALSTPTDPVTQRIVGSANYLMAGICSLTAGQPSQVCSSTAVTTAGRSLALH